MSERERYVRPLSSESRGEAPGRGRLQGRRILVVGGGQRTFDAATDPIGNGRAISILLAREGSKVAVADVNLQSARNTVEQIISEGGQAVPLQADISREEDVGRMIEQAGSNLAGLDGLVLVVGIFGNTGLTSLRVKEDWDDILAPNLRGPMLCCREGLDKLENGSSIVFISSISALRAGSRLVAYDASKAGLGGLMRHVAWEGSRRGIRANIVMPGMVDTPNGREAGAGRASRAGSVARIPFGRQATAWEIAYAVLFFLSGESVYITGQTLAVDSGITGF